MAAWPAEAGSLGLITGKRLPRHKKGLRPRSRVISNPAGRGKFYFDARGKYRIFNAACYRFYRSSSGPPQEGDTPFATSASLPHTPADTYAGGKWYLSMSYFNGVIDSGFLPLGAKGETYLRLDISGGAEVDSPPPGPNEWQLEVRPGGVIRVTGVFFAPEDGVSYDWNVAHTVDGSDPPEDSGSTVKESEGRGIHILSHDLGGNPGGTTVKVRLQMRTTAGGHSEDSVVKSAVADDAGPAAPPGGEVWPGRLPEKA